MHFVDTDVLVDILRGHPPAVEWLASIKDEGLRLAGFVVQRQTLFGDPRITDRAAVSAAG